jgi:two-component system response regulator RegA
MKASILVVDDDAMYAKMIRVTLETAGYRVEVADNIPEGEALAQTMRPQLALLDLRLGGIELARQLKSEPENEGLRVMVMTGFPTLGAREEAERAGCDAFWEKNPDRRTLLALIERLLADRS